MGQVGQPNRGLSFALAHELPPAGGSFELRYMVTRTLFPGFVMSAVFLVSYLAGGGSLRVELQDGDGNVFYLDQPNVMGH